MVVGGHGDARKVDQTETCSVIKIKQARLNPIKHLYTYNHHCGGEDLNMAMTAANMSYQEQVKFHALFL